MEFPGKELVFSPLFLDVSIRPGWFYHANESPKTLKELVHIYFRSVGLNYQLQLNVPPTPEGLFDPRDVAVMKEFGAYIEEVFAHDEARKAVDAVASSFTPGYPAINVVATTSSSTGPLRRERRAGTLSWCSRSPCTSTW